jgi:hypothetical protein
MLLTFLSVHAWLKIYPIKPQQTMYNNICLNVSVLFKLSEIWIKVYVIVYMCEAIGVLVNRLVQYYISTVKNRNLTTN